MKLDFLSFYLSINILIGLVGLPPLSTLIGEKIKKKLDSFTWLLLSWILCCACFICYDITVNRYNRKCDWMATSIHRVKCQLESKLYMYSTCKQDLSTVIVCQVLKKLSYESFWNIGNWQLVWFSYIFFTFPVKSSFK